MPLTSWVATQKATAVTTRCRRKRMSPPTSRPRPGRPASTAGGAGAYQILLLGVTLQPLRDEGTGHHHLHPVLTRPGEDCPGHRSGDSLTSGCIRDLGVDDIDRVLVDRTVHELGGTTGHLEDESVAFRVVLDVHPGRASLRHRP